MPQETDTPIRYVPHKAFTDFERDICKNNGRLFVRVDRMGFDLNDFVKKYMESDFCREEMDGPYTPRQMTWEGEIIYYLTQEVEIAKSDECYDEDTVWYIGYIYRYLQMRLGIPSSLLYERCPFNVMLFDYPAMHVHGDEWVVAEIGEDLFPERRNIDE